jgi:hypothetical protein
MVHKFFSGAKKPADIAGFFMLGISYALKTKTWIPLIPQRVCSAAFSQRTLFA